MSSSKKEKVEKPTEVFKFPQALHKQLLSLATEQEQINNEIGTIMQTFFMTMELDPKLYHVNLLKNQIFKAPIESSPSKNPNDVEPVSNTEEKQE